MGKRSKPSEAGSEPSFLAKSLEQLDGSIWREPEYGSYVVTTVHGLRKKPLQALSNEELRLALSQQIGLPWILELAVRQLEADPFRSGDFYPGDVLVCALKLPQTAWAGQSILTARLSAVVANARQAVGSLDETVRPRIEEALKRSWMK